MENRKWKEGKSSELIDLISGFAFKSANFLSEKRENTLPIIKIKNVANGDVNLNDVVYHEYNDKLSNYVIEKGDVLIAMTGNHIHAQTQIVGDVSLCKLDEPVLLNQRVGKFVAKNDADLKFAYYLFKDEETRFKLANKASGSANQANVSKTDILDLDILIPPLSEQKAIASVLSSLDDKIDLLHQQNQTLEALAETLFRQWFIEEAKEDWEEVKIGDLDIYISDYVANGSFASLKENVKLINDGVGYSLFIRNTDLKSGFNQKVYVDEHSYNFLSKTKLYGGEIIISNVADVGSVHICPKFDIPMTLGNNVIMLKSEYNYFLYLFFSSNIGQDLMYGITSGSVQQKFNKTDFKNSKITIKDKNQLIDFHNYVSIYFDKIESNKQQIQTLTQLRDTLLPKLMSGEVRV